MTSLVQSWKRTKAKGFEDYKKVMDLKANTSNNTVFADAKGNIAYWHGNYVPVRDTNYDWGKVVDGSTSKTEWKGLHAVDETVHSYNPVNGWLKIAIQRLLLLRAKIAQKVPISVHTWLLMVKISEELMP